MPVAVYPGSLDPITFGHLGAIQDTAECFGEVKVAIGVNPSKNYLFSLSEREALARLATKHIPGVSVTAFSGLLVHFLVRNNLNVVVRGIRNGSDLSDAMLQETIGWQQSMAEHLKAFYVPARLGQTFVSSTALKAVLKEQGDATHMAPLSTIHATQARMLGQYFYGVTGVSGSGKSQVCRKFAEIAQRRQIPILHVDMDKIGHEILGDSQEPLYVQTRQKIRQAFGNEIMDENGGISRKKLGEQVFGKPESLEKLNAIMHDPMFFRVTEQLRGQKGIFLIDAALLAETNKMSIVNNNMLVVTADDETLVRRLTGRDSLSDEQIQRRLSSQMSLHNKLDSIKRGIEQHHYGHLNILNNHDDIDDAEIEKAFDRMLNDIDIYGELRITSFFRSIGVANPTSAYMALRRFYAGDDRHQHNLSHIVDGLNKLSEFYREIDDLPAFILAWLFHDSVYDARSSCNEEDSVKAMISFGKEHGIESGLMKCAEPFILVTKHGKNQPETSDQKYLVDVDMSIIGESLPVFMLYEENVRREYQHLSDREWEKGRGAFLKSLSKPIFHTNYFNGLYGAQADRNIKASLAMIEI